MRKPTSLIGFKSLQLRLLFIVVLGTAIFSAAAGMLAYHLGQQRAVDTSLATLNDLAQAVEQTVAIGAFALDPVLLSEVADGLVRNSSVAMVEVSNLKGETLVQSSADEHLNIQNNTTNMVVKKPLYSPFNAHENIGVLKIYAAQSYISASASQEAKNLAIMMAAQAASVSLLLYAVIAWSVSRPITSLATKLRALPPGTTERLATPPLHTNDEVGMLIDSANTLLEEHGVALQRERALRAEIEIMEAQYRQIFDSSSAGIFVLDENGWLINSNPTVSKVLGVAHDQMEKYKHADFIESIFQYPEHARKMESEALRTNETIMGDLELRTFDGKRRWVHCLISVHHATWNTSSDEDKITEGVIYDITERKFAESAVRYQAEHDALTGLKNRSASYETINQFLSQSELDKTPVSILCIDLDGFKQINDEYGHDAGDQVLVMCANRLNLSVRRASDLVGRLGGDEFIVAMKGIGPKDEELTATANKILDALRTPISINVDKEILVTVGASIGIACAPVHGTARDILLATADASMYKVKRSGKNDFTVASLTA